MSNENLPQTAKSTDLSEKELVRVNKFIEDGLPGLTAVKETDLYRMMDMYFSGSTYHQISNAIGVKMPVVMYLSHTYGWHESRREYLEDLQIKIRARILDSKLESKNFLLLLSQALQKKTTKKLQRYLATDDESHAADIDLKEIAQLLKTIEIINGLDGEGKNSKGKTPAVGLNLGDGVVIERTGDKVTVTPKEKTLGDMLKHLADNRRTEESNKKEKESDIK